MRPRYFGPRPLVEDGSIWSNATTLANLEACYGLNKRAKLAVDVFNAADSDIDYYFYASRLVGEPADGVNDIHFHPALPRIVRVNVIAGF